MSADSDTQPGSAAPAASGFDNDNRQAATIGDSARDYVNLMREGKPGERLENVRQAFEQMQAPVAEA